MTEERERPGKLHLKSHLEREPMLFSAQLEVLLHMVVFEDCANQWSLSRPLLPLQLSPLPHQRFSLAVSPYPRPPVRSLVLCVVFVRMRMKSDISL